MNHQGKPVSQRHPNGAVLAASPSPVPEASRCSSLAPSSRNFLAGPEISRIIEDESFVIGTNYFDFMSRPFHWRHLLRMGRRCRSIQISNAPRNREAVKVTVSCDLASRPWKSHVHLAQGTSLHLSYSHHLPFDFGANGFLHDFQNVLIAERSFQPGHNLQVH